jgi:two-component system, OmpR family, response regulator
LGAALRIFFGEDDPEAPEAHRRDHSRLSPATGGEPIEGEASQPQVLVVEDDPAMQMLVAFNLRVAGFDVSTASTGREALARAPEQRFDLILLDVMLPDLGGFEVAEELRAAEPTRDVPLVFVSARTSPADLARGRAAGAVDYVTKPFDPVRLADRLREDLDELARGSADDVWELRFGRD